MAYDVENARLVLFGGVTAGGFGGYVQDTWEWDDASWVDQTPVGAKPSRRFDARMAYDSDRQKVVLVGGHDGTTNPSDVWEWQRPRQPAVLFTAGAASGSFSAEAIVGLRVRARCGGTFAPYDATSTGSSLLAWSTSGPTPGSWSLLGTNSAGLSTGWIDWTASSPAEAQRYYNPLDQQLTVQCRPSGTSAGAAQVAKVALDYVEVRVRY